MRRSRDLLRKRTGASIISVAAAGCVTAK